MKIAVIGCGHMGCALLAGLLKSGISDAHLIPIDPDERVRAQLEQRLKLHCGSAPDAGLRAVQALILSVKPDILADVARQIAPYLQTQLVISVAAGIRIAALARWLGGYSRSVREADRACAERILSGVGQIVWCLDEDQLDALTALCGSGPAYVFYFIEALEDAARRLGFDDTRARTLARTTFTGAAALAAQSGAAASALRAQVSPPNGTTAAALALFDAKRMREAIVRGVLAAHQRAIEIASAPGQD